MRKIRVIKKGRIKRIKRITELELRKCIMFMNRILDKQHKMNFKRIRLG